MAKNSGDHGLKIIINLTLTYQTVDYENYITNLRKLKPKF